MNSNTRESVVNELNTEENINFNDFKRVSNIIILILVTIFTINYKLPLIYIVKFLMNKIVNDILKYGIFKNIIGDGLPKPEDNLLIKLLKKITGRGIRPDGATNCSNFRDNFFNKNIVTKLATSYGFPSGHSQTAGYFAMFIILLHFKLTSNFDYQNNDILLKNKINLIINNFYINIKKPITIICLILILYSLYIPFTRVQLNCHTIQQVIFGYLFGLLTFILIEYIFTKLFNVKNLLI